MLIDKSKDRKEKPFVNHICKEKYHLYYQMIHGRDGFLTCAKM